MYRIKEFKGITYGDDTLFTKNISIKILNEKLLKPIEICTDKHCVYMPEQEVEKIFEDRRLLISDYFLNQPKANDFIRFHIMENPTDDTGYLEWYRDVGRELRAFRNGKFKSQEISEYGIITDIKDKYAYFRMYDMNDFDIYGIVYSEVGTAIDKFYCNSGRIGIDQFISQFNPDTIIKVLSNDQQLLYEGKAYNLYNTEIGNNTIYPFNCNIELGSFDEKSVVPYIKIIM